MSHSGFRRMMPTLPLTPWPATGEAGLIELGEAMVELDPPPPTSTLNTPKAGYTYLFQFIDHDLTLDLTSLGLARGSDLSRMVNFRNPRLDLEHVYGGGPQAWPFLYERSHATPVPRFLIGKTVASSIKGVAYPSTPNDLPRTSDGNAIVADPREDEVPILAQLHVAFLKLHNHIVDNSGLLDGSPYYRNTTNTFAAARRMLTWHYQWVVRHDCLRQILAPEVFDRLSELEAKGYPHHVDFQIPVEFSLGTFQFGHSMVRQQYFYNGAHPKAQFEELVQQTGVGGDPTFAGLPADWVIDWRRFFFVGGGSGMARHASAIDTRVAKGLHNLPGSGGPLSAHLSVRTMQRGDRVGLPCGQTVAASLGIEPLSTDEMLSGDHAAILQKYGYEKRTPLWYYILMEAELLGNGEKLGPVGSRIVARVIMDALLSDPDSYLSVAPEWTPTLPGPENPQLFGMANLLRPIL